MAITLRLNGQVREYTGDDKASLLDVLREEWQLKGTRFGCGQNQCGTCHVLIDGQSLPACDTPMWALSGKSLQTIEGLQSDLIGQALSQAFIQEQAAQCGYCISGIVVTAAALLRARATVPSNVPVDEPENAPANRSALSDAQVRTALDKHLCRCGAHNRIVRAILLADQSLSAQGMGQAGAAPT